MTTVPTFPEVKSYLGTSSASDAAVRLALEAETATQARVCRVDPYSADLGNALMRRVARNLAMKNVPLGVQMDELGAVRLGSTDPEVRRLEAPYRRLVIG